MARIFQYQAWAKSPRLIKGSAGGGAFDPGDSLVSNLTQNPDPPRSVRRQAWAPAVTVGPIAPVTARVEPTADAAVVYARNAEYPRPPKRVPQPHGVTAPDISNDRQSYGWARVLPDLPTRKKRFPVGVEPHSGPLQYPIIRPTSYLPLPTLPVRPVRRLMDAVGCAPVRQPLPRLAIAENCPPEARKKRLPHDCGPQRLFVAPPTFFAAENYRPAPMRRLVPQPCSPFAPVPQPKPAFFQFEGQVPRPRRRVRFELADSRTDLRIPVPGLVWFVQHHLPMMLAKRHPERPYGADDLTRVNLLPDDRPVAGDEEGDSDVAGG